jgi:plastocyanin
MVRRRAGRRIWLASGLAVGVLVCVTGLAFAASATIIGQANDTFSAGLYSTDQGEVSQLQVTGGSHNVTARQTGPDGKALFRSATITGGSTPVSGTQYLSTGAYEFFCTVHPTTMNGVLNVTANGTPQPRPSATLTVNTRKLSKVLKRGRLSVEISSTAKVDGVELVARLGKVEIARKPNVSWFPGQQFDKLTVTKAGKNKLRGRKKASITLTATIPFASPASAKAKLS